MLFFPILKYQPPLFKIMNINTIKFLLLNWWFKQINGLIVVCIIVQIDYNPYIVFLFTSCSYRFFPNSDTYRTIKIIIITVEVLFKNTLILHSVRFVPHLLCLYKSFFKKIIIIVLKYWLGLTNNSTLMGTHEI